MTARRSATETHIPLYLIPHVIARQINKQGEDVYRISVKRILWHHYNVTIRIKSLKRECKPRNVVLHGDNPVNNDNDLGHDDVSHDHDSGGAP
ncbi:MAG: hypothetical protein WC294_10515 [Methanoregula sp.]|jgi:hypothetical protein